MTYRHALGSSLALLLLGCGTSVAVESSSGGGSSSSSGTGGAASSSSSTGGTTSTTTSTSTSTTTTGGTGGTGGVSPCSEITSEVTCLGRFPLCVPVYDDACCPSCEPMGGCANCIDIHFHHCADFAAGCTTAACAAPSWACAGMTATCAIDPGVSKTPCHAAAGCTAGYCPLGQDCKTDPICVPVTNGSCTTLCDAIPPPCPMGTIAAANGSCYTGTCIPAEICAP